MTGGSIPAFTGETPSRGRWRRFSWVYPRIHGGNAALDAYIESGQGLSPHSRGKRRCSAVHDSRLGSIPAFTGETPPHHPPPAFVRVYPRIHGGNWHSAEIQLMDTGLSPHSRGKRSRLRCFNSYNGSIPAFTGETLFMAASSCSIQVYPRIHGGNRICLAKSLTGRGLSPHSRGKLLALQEVGSGFRSIPAFTGETTPSVLTATDVKVYPRIHGGNAQAQGDHVAHPGLSPHSRGKRKCWDASTGDVRSIPAFTGETH